MLVQTEVTESSIILVDREMSNCGSQISADDFLNSKPIKEIKAPIIRKEITEEEHDSKKKKMKETLAFLDGEEEEVPIRVLPLNRKIMTNIRSHFEQIPIEKKWPFLNMLQAWS